MPTIASVNLPSPTSWEEFERILLSASKLRWNSSKFYGNGRSGQEQNGVDIWGNIESDYIGIQCKNTPWKITLAVVKDEIKKAEKFEPNLSHLYVATSALRDAVLQEKIREISSKRQSENKFAVDILFWEDIVQDLAKDKSVLFTHYPQFKVDQFDAVLKKDTIIAPFTGNVFSAFISEDLDLVKEDVKYFAESLQKLPRVTRAFYASILCHIDGKRVPGGDYQPFIRKEKALRDIETHDPEGELRLLGANGFLTIVPPNVRNSTTICLVNFPGIRFEDFYDSLIKFLSTKNIELRRVIVELDFSSF